MGSNDASSFFLEVPLTHEQLELMKRTVSRSARGHLVGRKFIKVYGPIGAGAQSVTWDTFLPPVMANIDLLGEAEQQPVHTQRRAILNIPQIYKDFILYGRDIAASHDHDSSENHNYPSHDRGHNHNHHGCICMPLDLSALVNAVVQCAKKEDDMIFSGLPEMGIPGLTNVEGRNIQPMKDWSILGNGFQDVVEAAQKLTDVGFYGPYAMVMSPHLYALLHRVYEKTGVLEIKSIKALIKGGVFQSSVLKSDVAIVVAMDQSNMDLVIGQDMRVSYWGPENLNHRFRVWESAVLRIKCPQAICTIEP
ncbi:MAG: hypothetical protein SCARUB_01799 [Candidatus Scalindua rubra]|uniref:Bacteriocin n=1 Tax=Candidatus Scalindua rubra TaxID=1872076 RepID=A0A1E3XBX5_9BACT|nr:MAG: hypothetical protein SCARUB_01799 [Candidatus Scalindua rubra]